MGAILTLLVSFAGLN